MHSSRAALTLIAALSLVTTTQGAEETTATRHAVVVGINQMGDPQVPPLAFARADARAVAEVLRGGGYEVALLTDAPGDGERRATRETLEAELGRAARASGRDGILLFYFSGNGFQSDGGAQLLPADGSADRPESVLRLSEACELLASGFACHKLVLIDACRNDPTPSRAVAIRGGLDPMPLGFAMVQGCAAGERSYESESLGHGVFTHALLAGLRGGAANSQGEVRLFQLAGFVEGSMRDRAFVREHLPTGRTQQAAFAANLVGNPLILAATAEPNAAAPPARSNE